MFAADLAEPRTGKLLKIADRRYSPILLPPIWNTGFYRPRQPLSRRQKQTGRPVKERPAKTF